MRRAIAVAVAVAVALLAVSGASAVAALWLLYRLAGERALLIGVVTGIGVLFAAFEAGRLQRRGKGGAWGAAIAGLTRRSAKTSIGRWKPRASCGRIWLNTTGRPRPHDTRAHQDTAWARKQLAAQIRSLLRESLPAAITTFDGT